jgi:hypothetical protein
LRLCGKESGADSEAKLPGESRDLSLKKLKIIAASLDCVSNNFYKDTNRNLNKSLFVDRPFFQSYLY